MKQLSLREIQRSLLDILKDVDSFCRNRGLRYSLAYGTLLGAVRHKGFIPWDDDIDLVMPRPDFECFIREYAAAPGRPFQCLYRSEFREFSFFNFFAKVIDPSTYGEGSREGDRIGVSVDIFPLDGKCPDLSEQEKRERRLGHLTHGILLRQRPLFPFTFHDPLVAKMAAHVRSLDRLLADCDEMMLAYDFDASAFRGSAPIGSRGAYEPFARPMYEQFEEMEFEGFRFMAVDCPDTYLRQIFGDDYGTLPPGKDRKSHGLRIFGE